MPSKIRKLNLREQFYKERRKLEKRLVEEQAFIVALGGGVTEQKQITLFKNFDYDKIYKQGVSRKNKGSTVYYKGQMGVKLQIKSFQKRSSKIFQKQRFLENYKNAMIKAGVFESQEIFSVYEKLKGMSYEYLSFLIHKGILPSINFIYTVSIDSQLQEFRERLAIAFDPTKHLDVIKNKKTRKEIENTKVFTKTGKFSEKLTIRKKRALFSKYLKKLSKAQLKNVRNLIETSEKIEQGKV